MTDDHRKPDEPGLETMLGLSLSTATAIATTALVEVARLGGIERLDALHDRARMDAKQATIEGLSIVADATAMNGMLTMVDFIFKVARDELRSDVQGD